MDLACRKILDSISNFFQENEEEKIKIDPKLLRWVDCCVRWYVNSENFLQPFCPVRFSYSANSIHLDLEFERKTGGLHLGVTFNHIAQGFLLEKI